MSIPERNAEQSRSINLSPLVGVETLPPAGIPLVVLSNHCFSLKMLPAVLALGNYRNDLTMVCNAGFSPFLNLAGIETINIPVENPRSVGKETNAAREIWRQAIYGVAVASGANTQGLKGQEAVEAMLKKLESGGAVWITPRGCRESATKQGKWRSGLGKLLKTLLTSENLTEIAMVYVNQYCRGKVIEVTNVGRLAKKSGLNSLLSSTGISRLVKQHYWSRVRSQRFMNIWQ